jgi:hypothetical protein
MRWLCKSATKALPWLSTAIEIGRWKRAAIPFPSLKPAVPLPARVETTPSGEGLTKYAGILGNSIIAEYSVNYFVERFATSLAL